MELTDLHLKFSSKFWLVGLPLILMVFDCITGYVSAWKNKEIKSSKMRDGLSKKLAETIYIFCGFILSLAFSIEIISYFISIYISYMELTSIYENCKKLGVKMPDNLEDKMKDEVNNEKEKF